MRAGQAAEFRHGELDLGQCRALIDELARMQVFQINFGGGEPFLRADFLTILGLCHERGITTCVSTNGTLLSEALVDELQGHSGMLVSNSQFFGDVVVNQANVGPMRFSNCGFYGSIHGRLLPEG